MKEWIVVKRNPGLAVSIKIIISESKVMAAAQGMDDFRAHQAGVRDL